MILGIRLTEIKYHFVNLPFQKDIVEASLPLIDECIQLYEAHVNKGQYVSAQLRNLKESILKSKDIEWTRHLLEKVPGIMDSLSR